MRRSVRATRAGLRFFKRLLFLALFLAVVAASILGLGVYYHLSRDLPDITALKDFRPSTVTQVFARDGRLIGEFFAEKRLEVPL